MLRIDEEIIVRWQGSSFSVWVSETSDSPPSFSWDLPPPSNQGSPSPTRSIPQPAETPPSDPCPLDSPPQQPPHIVSSVPAPRGSPQPSSHGPMHGDPTAHAPSRLPKAAGINDRDILTAQDPQAHAPFLFCSQGFNPSKMGRSRKRPRHYKSPSSFSPPLLHRPTSLSTYPPTTRSPALVLPSLPSSEPSPTVLIPSSPSSPSSSRHAATVPPSFPIVTSSSSASPGIFSGATANSPIPFPHPSPQSRPLPIDQEVLETIKIGSALGFNLGNSSDQVAAIIDGERGQILPP